VVDDNFHIKEGPCIVITGKGYPDIATRQFVKKIANEVTSDHTPLLGLFDWGLFLAAPVCPSAHFAFASDPYGLEILSVYAAGSLNRAYEGENLTVPNMKNIGICYNDIETFNLPPETQLPTNERSILKIKSMLARDCILARPKWR
jgi:meiotic recombination protein SPO11